MTSKLIQLQSKAAQASQLVAKHGGSYYRQLLERNKQYIQDPPTAEKCNLLSKQLLYTRLARLSITAIKLANGVALEMNLERVDGRVNLLGISEGHANVSRHLPISIPGRYEAFGKELDSAKQLWKNRKELKVEDAGIAALFGLECFAWFCAGEIVGRGFTFTGYYV
ncbi:hypothetical protein OIU76_008963 [Salix suchowensis]|nr:hypothetical protein OIU76_008963 [Salix suchowensis]KAJ6361600.1 hypothetical protein OIU78_002100 [Salix suchowensis]